ncbi:hypothetical protein D3C85_1658160 [compost metagenome]
MALSLSWEKLFFCHLNQLLAGLVTKTLLEVQFDLYFSIIQICPKLLKHAVDLAN